MGADKEERPVEAEVVGAPPRTLKPRTYFHPLSGLIILGIDWLAFGLDLFSDFVAVPLVCVSVFALTFVSVQAVQERLHGDKPNVARLKALLGAIAAGLPFPITGTILGSAILALSGLDWRRSRSPH